MNNEWINVKDRKPEHGQHVLVWENRYNVFPFPRGNKGDDGEGRIRMGDAIYRSGDVAWSQRSDKHHWNNNKADFIEANNRWDTWSGHGPCGFSDDDVTHWIPLPFPPSNS